MPKLVGLQVLRALAALAIVLVHVEPDIASRSGGIAPVRFFPWEAGVDVFFVISGFVMVYASGPLFERRHGAWIFLARRIARIVPLYWLTTAAVLFILVVRPDLMRSAVATPALTLASFLFVPLARPDGAVQPVYSLGWTLNYEMFFYAVFAATLWLPRRRAVAAAGAFLVVLVAAGLLLRPLAEPLAFWTSRILVEFVVGMALGLARVEGVTLGRAARIGLALTGIGIFALLGGEAVRTTGLHQTLLFTVPAACLVASCSFVGGRRTGDESPLERLGAALGDASYAIYLLHPFAVRGLAKVIDATGSIVPPFAFAMLALAAAVALALASYRLVERPSTRWVRRRLESSA